MQGPEKLRGLLQVGSQCLSIGSSANACKAVLKESKGANFFQNDRLSPISPAHDMADGSFLFDPELEECIPSIEESSPTSRKKLKY
jgi:hypothetical protein